MKFIFLRNLKNKKESGRFPFQFGRRIINLKLKKYFRNVLKGTGNVQRFLNL